MKLDLCVQYGAGRAGAPAAATIRRWARAAMQDLHRERVLLGVRIVNNAEAATLNRRYRGKRGPTNVLSFPFEAPSGTRSENLGDLVICAPLVRREARQQQKTVRAHWAHLVVHGILHLRGFDHRRRQEAAVMEQMETRILAELGFPDPYRS